MRYALRLTARACAVLWSFQGLSCWYMHSEQQWKRWVAVPMQRLSFRAMECGAMCGAPYPIYLFLQVGAIRAASSTQPILLKNIGDAAVSLAAWYLVGNSIAFGTDVRGVFGKPSLFMAGETGGRDTSWRHVLVSFLGRREPLATPSLGHVDKSTGPGAVWVLALTILCVVFTALQCVCRA